NARIIAAGQPISAVPPIRLTRNTSASPSTPRVSPTSVGSKYSTTARTISTAQNAPLSVKRMHPASLLSFGVLILRVLPVPARHRAGGVVGEDQLPQPMSRGCLQATAAVEPVGPEPAVPADLVRLVPVPPQIIQRPQPLRCHPRHH